MSEAKPASVNCRELLERSRPLSPEILRRMDAYWRAANYLSVEQIYLYENPLLREPLALTQVKPLLVGHRGTVPGQTLIYVHLNGVSKQYDLNMIYVSGPGHGGQALLAHTFLEGSYSEIYPDITQDEAGLKKLFAQVSFPGGISSHVAPSTRGSIHDGGELGYSLSHALSATARRRPATLATAWHFNKFHSPLTDGAVLPILHLNGYKISNPTVLARIDHAELDQFLSGCGWIPVFVEGDEPALMHALMADTLDRAVTQIQEIQDDARQRNVIERARWPMIVLRSPKGWTGPEFVDGLPTYRRANRNLHVHGHTEEGTITTAFDMRVQNKIDRFHLVIKVLDCLELAEGEGARLKQMAHDKLIEHKQYIRQHGRDLPEIRHWKWCGTSSITR